MPLGLSMSDRSLRAMLYNEGEQFGRPRPSSFTGTIHLATSRSELSESCDAYIMDVGTPVDTSVHPKSELDVLDRDQHERPTTLEYGALRPGGTVDLFSRQYIGLLIGWAIAGFFYATMGRLSHELLAAYTSASDFQLNAAKSLATMPWLFKFVAGYATDCVPIHRRRRKPYVVIGWGLFMVFMFAMACINLPSPHQSQFHPTDQLDSGGVGFALALAIGSFAHLLASAALEGVMIECAQREGEFVRGRTQCLCVMARFSGQFVGTLSLSLAFNSSEFGGTFAGYVPIRAVFVFFGVVAGSGIVITLLWLHEDKLTHTTPRWTTQMRQIWGLMQRRSTSLVTVVGFLMRVGTNYKVYEWVGIPIVWLRISPLGLIVAGAMVDLGFVAAAAFFLLYLRNTNWRSTLVGSLVVTLILGPPIQMMVVFDAWRSLGLFLLEHHIAEFADSLRFLLRAVMIVEVVEPGYEVVTYGLITTVINLGDAIMTTVQNVLATTFAPAVTDLSLDSSAVRHHIANQYLAMYILWIITLVVVTPLLPRQKRHIKEISERGGASIIVPAVLCVLFALLFCLSATSTLLGMFASTSCLVFAGGRGCGK